MGVNLLVFISVPGTQFHDVNGLICPVGAAAGPLCQIQNTRYIRRMQEALPKDMQQRPGVKQARRLEAG